MDWVKDTEDALHSDQDRMRSHIPPQQCLALGNRAIGHTTRSSARSPSETCIRKWGIMSEGATCTAWRGPSCSSAYLNSMMPRPMRDSTGTLTSTGCASCTSREKGPKGPEVELLVSTGEKGASRCEMSPTNVREEQFAAIVHVSRDANPGSRTPICRCSPSSRWYICGNAELSTWTLRDSRSATTHLPSRPDGANVSRRAGRWYARRSLAHG